MLTPGHEQGATLGVAQSVSSFARIIAPVFATTLYAVEASLPYLICAAVSLVSGVVAWSYLHKPAAAAAA